MIPLKFLIGAGILLAVGLGGYFTGRTDGKAVVQAELDRQRLVWTEEFAKKAAETDRIQGEWDKAKERANEIEGRLDAVTADASTLAERLRQHTRRRVCAVPQAPSSTGAAPEAGGESEDTSGVDEALEQHLAACARDAERLTGWQTFYQGLVDSQ